MAKSATTVLIVEDDAILAEVLGEFLNSKGFDAIIESNGADAVDRIRDVNPDIVILDVMLPSVDGFEVCRRVRQFYSGAILMLTGRTTEIDHILGLELGADDYVTKPVPPSLLLARLRALLRRVDNRAANGDTFAQTAQIGCLVLHYGARQALIGTTNVELTTIEFDLLWLLAQQAGSTVERDSIYRELLNREYDGLDRTVDVHISKLRRKLVGQGGEADWIKTVHGRGYQLFVQAS
ncbi:MAG: response regulator transcription factor [Bradymonadaceae bacterium]|nr:response regulator transcription factor [Lujinxingiaceae bacterium]